MNREIKFRQKNSETEKWHYWGFIGGGFITPLQGTGGGNESQQFTGLKDKNGVEIYEGDYLKTNEGTYLVVRWWDKHARWTGTDLNKSHPGFALYMYAPIAEIVGNEYETSLTTNESEKPKE